MMKIENSEENFQKKNEFFSVITFNNQRAN